MSKKTLNIIGWVLSGVLAIMFLMSASMKLMLNPEFLEKSKALNLSHDVIRALGAIEALAVILMLIPRTGVVGSLLLIAYMGGAMAAHLVTGQPVGMLIVFQVIIWANAAIRFPEVSKRLFHGVQENA
ncbi:MAG: DoxX family protein [Chitinophagales bacterium]|jgi:hypothetical protein|nr:DoxX family protein [Chitinophagales bacterium]